MLTARTESKPRRAFYDYVTTKGAHAVKGTFASWRSVAAFEMAVSIDQIPSAVVASVFRDKRTLELSNQVWAVADANDNHTAPAIMAITKPAAVEPQPRFARDSDLEPFQVVLRNDVVNHKTAMTDLRHELVCSIDIVRYLPRNCLVAKRIAIHICEVRCPACPKQLNLSAAQAFRASAIADLGSIATSICHHGHVPIISTITVKVQHRGNGRNNGIGIVGNCHDSMNQNQNGGVDLTLHGMARHAQSMLLLSMITNNNTRPWTFSSMGRFSPTRH